MHRVLAGALLAGVEAPLRSKTRRFLRGLSADELQFLAGFCGSCILESSWISDYQTSRHPSDQDLKMILLVEYLNHSGLDRAPARA